MGDFFLNKFYLFFQGVIVFQTLFFIALFFITKRKDIFYYGLFLLINTIYFFWNAPFTFFNVSDDEVFNSNLYQYSNIPLVICTSVCYILFLKAFFKDVFFSHKLIKIYKITFTIIPILFITFFAVKIAGFSEQLIFYIVNGISTAISMFILKEVYVKQIKNTIWVSAGIVLNILGTTLTLLMIVLWRYKVHHILTDDYPLFFIRCGILFDIFFFQIAMLKNWHTKEKLLAVERITNQLSVEKMRNQISSELHDDIGATLSGINMYGYLAKKQIEDNQQQEVEKSINIIQHSAREMVDKLNDIIWSVSPKDELLENLMDKLSKYARLLAATKQIEVKIALPENIAGFIIKAAYKHQVYLIFKEAINNAVKYSQCTLLEIHVFEEGNILNIFLNDNGVGLNNNTLKRGNGLSNMETRAIDIKADLKIVSHENKGMRIEVFFLENVHYLKNV